MLGINYGKYLMKLFITEYKSVYISLLNVRTNMYTLSDNHFNNRSGCWYCRLYEQWCEDKYFK